MVLPLDLNVAALLTLSSSPTSANWSSDSAAVSAIEKVCAKSVNDPLKLNRNVLDSRLFSFDRLRLLGGGAPSVSFGGRDSNSSTDSRDILSITSSGHSTNYRSGRISLIQFGLERHSSILQRSLIRLLSKTLTLHRATGGWGPS